MSLIRNIPMSAYVLLFYNIILLINFSGGAIVLSENLMTLDLLSGAKFTLSGNELFLIIGLIFLYIEVLKSTKTSKDTIIDHLFSMIVFVVFLIEFIVVEKAGNTTFLLLMLMSFFDVISGFTVSISTARRDFAMGD
ncbi:MAG: hypothetical protein HON94_13105 [Methylococcales bacterium]|jgi:hypothetical protein|nr:hypothetical protein [Methylococcales bacterium]